MFPAESAYRAERQAVLATMESLTREELETAPTLCSEWAPRDVLSHLIGIDEAPLEYAKALGNVNRGNARIVERFRAMSTDDLLDRAREWVAKPAVLSLMGAYGLLGDLGVHHQDVLRPLGRRRDIPPAVSKAILREGLLFGGTRLRRYRIEPTDVGRAVGRGTVVRGTAEQIGMWLCGRKGIADELTFSG